MPGPTERAALVRRRKLLNLRRRGVFGVSYGMSAFGYPIGELTGVQGPSDPPVNPDQFGDIGAVAGDGGTTADSGSGSSGDSGGAP